MKTARDTGMATSKLVRDVADLLALGFLRYRQRADEAGDTGAGVEASAETVRKALDDVPRRASLRPGDRRTSKTETTR